MQAKLTLVIYSVLFGSTILSAQPPTPQANDYSKLIEVLSPSPNAASLGKYGGIDVSLASGAANVSLAIYTHQSTNITVPITLNYTSYGFKVDEMASRVGTSWSLNAGGVITRTACGQQDEASTRVTTLPGVPNSWSRDWINFLNNLAAAQNTSTGAIDAQPDLFSFNIGGVSGRFILDNDLNPILLDHSNIKIEKDFQSANWNFKITTDQGIQYLFGGSTAKEVTKRISAGDCSNIFPVFTPTAWYLERIIHPNNDTVFFKYDPIYLQYYAGVSQTMFGYEGLVTTCPGLSPTIPTIDNQFCETVLATDAVLLTEIYSSSGGKVKFHYVNRTDNGRDKLLSSIEILQPGKTVPIKTFSLEYLYSKATNYKNSYSLSDSSLCYRPFLTEVQENSNDNLLHKKHSFTYYNLSSLPPRLSYAQDHYGYFNGKANTTLVPVPKSALSQANLPYATADREVDPSFAMRGLLATIVYPTGGKDSLVYEGNQVYQEVTTYPSETMIVAMAAKPYNISVPPGIGVTVNSASSATISYDQKVRLELSCSYSAPDHNDPNYSETVVEIIDENTNTVFYTTTLLPNESRFELLNLVSGHSYKIKSTTYGYNVSGGAALHYRPGLPVIQNLNVNTAGIRLFKTISIDGVSQFSSVKKYLYETLDEPGVSTCGSVAEPIYEKRYFVYQNCTILYQNDPGYTEGVSYPYPCNMQKSSFFSAYSNSLRGLMPYSSPATYSSVIESYGENFENGGVEHHFSVIQDMPATKLFGEDLLGMPRTSNFSKNAKEQYQCVFKKVGSNVVPIKKTFIHYKNDSRKIGELKAYIVNKKYSPPCNYSGYPAEVESSAYDFYSFSYLQNWMYVDEMRTWSYDVDGQNYLEDIAITEYANASHALPTLQKTYRSNNTSKSEVIAYPQDITLTGNAETARLNLIAKHILSPVLSQTTSINTTQTFKVNNYFKIFPNGLVLKESVETKNGTSTADKRIEFLKYNDQGNILMQHKANDIKMSYEWGYKDKYPIVEITNAQYGEAVYDDQLHSTTLTIPTGVNETSTALLSYGGTFSLSLDAHPGKTYTIEYGLVGPEIRSGTLCVSSSSTPCHVNHSPSITFDDMPAGNYTLYLYYYGSDPDVFRRVSYTYPRRQVVTPAYKEFYYQGFEESDGNSSNGDSKAGAKSKTNGYTKSITNLTDGEYVLSYWKKNVDNSWALQKSIVTVAGGSYYLNLSGQIDEIRLHPKKVKMNTYTYEPLIGVTSKCDINNKFTFYEYDSFGRLKTIRDQDGNVVKTFDYQYQLTNN